MSDGMFMPRHEQHALVELLREIPALLVHLKAVITNQERVSTGGPRVSTGEREQPLPFNATASEAGTALHAELAYWVRWACEPRGVTFWPVGYTHTYDFIGPLRSHERRIPSRDFRDSTTGLALWLDQNVVALAMTEGSEDALHYIAQAIDAVRKVSTLPKERPRRPLGEEEIEVAADAELHRDGIAKLAREMGPKWAGLTAKRVDTLRRRDQIQAVRCLVATKAELFNVGDVLVAHLTYPTRKRRTVE